MLVVTNISRKIELAFANFLVVYSITTQVVNSYSTSAHFSAFFVLLIVFDFTDCFSFGGGIFLENFFHFLMKNRVFTLCGKSFFLICF